MECWLLLSSWALGRALTLAEKQRDLATVERIAESLRPWVDAA